MRRLQLCAITTSLLLACCSGVEDATAAPNQTGETNTSSTSSSGVPAEQIDEYVAKARAEQQAKTAAIESVTIASNASSPNALPSGETGRGEAVEVFLDICVTRMDSDLAAVFQNVKDGGYRVIKEKASIADNQITGELVPILEASAISSPSGSEQKACPIRVEVDFSSLAAICKVEVHQECDRGMDFGLLFEQELLKVDYVLPNENLPSKNSASDAPLQKRFFAIEEADTNVEVISLEYRLSKKGYAVLQSTLSWRQE